MSTIERIQALQILDSRATPTIEVEVRTSSGVIGRADVPSGASTGAHEAVELRDKDTTRFAGKGVLTAVKNVETILAPALLHQPVEEQKKLDALMIDLDGTENKSKLGANAILGVSLAIARAAAQDLGLPLFQYIGGEGLQNILPMPMMNVLNGGVHADNNMDIQEFMIVPVRAESFSQAIEASVGVFFSLKEVLRQKGLSTNVGDEGGFAPQLGSNEAAIEILLEAIHKAGYTAGKDFQIALDAASTEMYDPKTRHYVFYKSAKDRCLNKEEMVGFWEKLVHNYPIFSIEDPMSEDDWEGWQLLNKNLGNKVQLVGDDLFVTNKKRLQKGIDNTVANSILVKINQIGTISETIDTVRLAQAHHYTTIMSHRSGETEDTSIADLAVALNCGQIKTGGLSRTDRTAKYNQLLRIEALLGGKAKMMQLKNLRA